MKIFDATAYVRCESYQFGGIITMPADVEPLEEYLQLQVKSMWDYNPNGYYIINSGGFSYYVTIRSKKNNSENLLCTKLKPLDITDEHIQLIKTILK